MRLCVSNMCFCLCECDFVWHCVGGCMNTFAYLFYFYSHWWFCIHKKITEFLHWHIQPFDRMLSDYSFVFQEILKTDDRIFDRCHWDCWSFFLISFLLSLPLSFTYISYSTYYFHQREPHFFRHKTMTIYWDQLEKWLVMTDTFTREHPNQYLYNRIFVRLCSNIWHNGMYFAHLFIMSITYFKQVMRCEISQLDILYEG